MTYLNTKRVAAHLVTKRQDSTGKCLQHLLYNKSVHQLLENKERQISDIYCRSNRYCKHTDIFQIQNPNNLFPTDH